MDDRLKQEIENNAIAQVKKPQANTLMNQRAFGSPLSTNAQVNIPIPGAEKDAQFFRSKRSVAMRIKDGYEEQVQKLENDKLGLIQKLNDALVTLDKLNQEKAQMSEKLIEMLKFVRDMQRETQKCDDLTAVVNDDLRGELRSEKEKSHQLKEAMKQAEMERLRLLSRIHELSHYTQEGELVQSDMNVDLTTKTRTFAQLQEEYKDVLERITHCEAEVDRLRALTIANQEQIGQLRTKISQVVDDKRSTLVKLNNTQAELDLAIDSYERERREMDLMQTRHLRLISCTLLFATISESHKKNQLTVFNMVKSTAYIRDRRLHCLLRMRKVLKHHRSTKLKRFLLLWYINATKPMRTKAQLNHISLKMRAKEPKHVAFYAWQCALIRSVQAKHIKRQVLQSFLQSTEEYNRRAVQYSWTKWRDMIRLREGDKPQAINKLLMRKHRKHAAKYFNRWREAQIESDFHIQMHGLAQRLAFKKYLSVLFSQWRIVTTDLKVRRVSILTRTMLNLRINAMTRKQMRCQTWSILREGKKYQENLVKECFDAMRFHKEQEKAEKTKHQLVNVERPRRQQAEAVIDMVSQVDGHKFQSKAVQALAKCFGKQIQQYFTQWRQAAEQKTNVMQTTLKQRIIKAYLGQLRKAFTRWLDYKGAQMISYQSEVIQNYEEEAKHLQVEIQESKLDIDERKQRQQCQSGKQMKKIFFNAFTKRLREHFYLWKANLDSKQEVLDHTEKVLARLNRRQKRQAFTRYLDKIRELRQAEAFDKQVADIRFKLREKMRHRVFKAILQFSQTHTSAKNYLRRLLTSLDLSLKDTSFKKWLRFKHHRDEKLLSHQQNEKVEVLARLSDELHSQTDVLEDIVQQNKRLKKNLGNNSRRIIRHAFARCLEASCQHAFAKWDAYVREERRKERIMRSAILHMLRGQLSMAFRQWKKAQSHIITGMLSDAIFHQEKQLDVIENTRKLQDRSHAVEKDQAQTKLLKIQETQQNLIAKHQNTLKALITRRDTMDHVDSRRYILHQWHSFVQQRKCCLKLMETAINKTLWHQGLLAIKEAAKTTQAQETRLDWTQKLILSYSKVKLRQGFNQWRKSIHQQTVLKTHAIHKEILHLTKKHDFHREQVQLRVEEQLIQHRQHLKLLDCYTGWKNYIKSEKHLRIKREAYASQSQARDQARAVRKWAQRVAATQRFRHVQEKIDRVYTRNLAKTILLNWQEYNYRSKNMVRSLGSLAILLDRVFVHRSFRTLKTEAQSRQFTRDSHKVRSCQALVLTLSQAVLLNKRQTITTLRQHCLLSKKLSLGQRATIKYYLTRRIREYFQEWKAESQRRTLVKSMNEEGPVAIECHNLKKILYNLKQAAIEDGIEPQQVQQVIQASQSKSIMTIEKSICRLFCYNEELYLLPQSLDRWKKWVQYRKLFRYWLNHLDKKVNDSGIYHAFQKWKYVDLAMVNELNKKTKPQLERIHVANQQKMLQLADDLDLADGTIRDLTDQRDLLVKRYVGSQRLALAVSNAQCDRAKQKTLSRWVDSVASSNQGNLEDALKKNLDRIKFLKERIKHFERSNQDLADQNEELRQGALDGIEMAKTIDDLTREREKLSVDLADKAIVIRKLLEDNNNLSVRLSNAQDEAHNLIKMSQMKLQSEQRGLQYLDDY